MPHFLTNLINKFRQHHFIRRYPHLKEVAKYSIVGNAANILDFGIYIYLTRAFLYWKERYILADISAMLVASIARFYFHKKWTFRDNGKQVELQFFKFTALLCLTFILNILILYTTVEHLNINDIIGKLIASILTTGIMYIGSRYWVFKNKQKRILSY